MHQKRIISIFAGALLVIAASTVLAHHGWSGYKEVIEMSATVTELKLGNPHDRLISEESINVGDEIDLYGQKHPQRNEIKVHCLYRNDEMLYTYRYDNGRSSLSRSRRASKESC
jgi:hypothetical protein